MTQVEFVRLSEKDIPSVMEKVRDEVDEIYRKEILMTALGHLKARDRKVISLRFWASKSLERIGKEDLGVTSERVRQIESKALRILRGPQFQAILKEVRP